jgi:hypothetical protein
MAKGKTKEVEVEEDAELEELDSDEVEETPSKSKAAEVTFGVAQLCEYLTKKTGKAIKPKELRTLIRKMAREENARVNREIVAGNKSRYDWPDGLQDPEVKRIVKAVTGGELEEGKKEALAKLKEQKAAKTAEKQKDAAKGGKKGKKGKAAPAPAAEDDDEIEDLELDDD